MQVAAQLRPLHERRQPSGERGFELAAVLAQFRRNVRQADGREHGPFRLAGDALAPAEHAVLVDLEAAGVRDAAQPDVVRLAAGEIIQRRAEALLGHDAHVHLQPVAQYDRGARRPGRERRRGFVEPAEGGIDAGAGRRADDDVQVADRLAAAAETAGDFDAGDARQRRQIVAQAARDGSGNRRTDALAVARERRERLAQALLEFRAEARHVADAMPVEGVAQAVQSANVERLVERACTLRPDARQRQEFAQARGHRSAQGFEHAAAARGRELADLPGEILADSRQRVGIEALRDLVREFPGLTAHDARGLPIGADAERILAAQGQEVGHFVERDRDLFVVHGHCASLGVLPNRHVQSRQKRTGMVYLFLPL